MSYEQAIKWNKKHPKGTRQSIIMHTESGFTPSNAFLTKYFKYRDNCKKAKIKPAECEEYYKNTEYYNRQLIPNQLILL